MFFTGFLCVFHRCDRDSYPITRRSHANRFYLLFEKEDREKHLITLRKLNITARMKKYNLRSFTERAKPDDVLDTLRSIGLEGEFEHLIPKEATRSYALAALVGELLPPAARREPGVGCCRSYYTLGGIGEFGMSGRAGVKLPGLREWPRLPHAPVVYGILREFLGAVQLPSDAASARALW